MIPTMLLRLALAESLGAAAEDPKKGKRSNGVVRRWLRAFSPTRVLHSAAAASTSATHPVASHGRLRLPMGYRW